MEVKVSRLTGYIANIFNTDPIMMNIGVIGEISNLKYHQSGAVFFTLKDDKAAIRCNMWRQAASHLRYRLEDGMEVTAFGRVSVYEKGGTYSLNVEDVKISGEGSLMAAARALADKLRAAGYFSDEHKKPIPAFPRRVCVITSSTGAALRDMLKIIRSRNNITDVLIYPVLVQGPSAAGEIAGAIEDVNARFDDVDTIIAGRGGGSLEDLWAFNEEPVARAIYNSEIPVISAVGHETDFTIADFVADRRAETPTAAANMAVPDTAVVRADMDRIFSYGIRDRLDSLCRNRELALERCSPGRLIGSLKNQYAVRAESLSHCRPEELSVSVRARTEKYAAGLEFIIDNLRRSVRDKVSSCGSDAEKMKIMLEAGNPDRIVKRGYAIVTDDRGQAVTSAGDLSAGDRLTVRLKDGTAVSEVKKVTVNK